MKQTKHSTIIKIYRTQSRIQFVYGNQLENWIRKAPNLQNSWVIPIEQSNFYPSSLCHFGNDNYLGAFRILIGYLEALDVNFSTFTDLESIISHHFLIRQYLMLLYGKIKWTIHWMK